MSSALSKCTGVNSRADGALRDSVNLAGRCQRCAGGLVVVWSSAHVSIASSDFEDQVLLGRMTEAVTGAPLQAQRRLRD